MEYAHKEDGGVVKAIHIMKGGVDSGLNTLKEAEVSVEGISVVEEGSVHSSDMKAFHEKRGLEDESDKSTPETKRLKADLPLKDASLSALADATTNQNTAQTPVGLTSLYSFPYYPFIHSYPQPMLDPEGYQLLVSQPPLMRMEGIPTPRQHEEEISTPQKRGRSRMYSPSPGLGIGAVTSPQYTGRFVLLEQPNVRQRKSYKNENRYILPNPLSVSAREEGPGEKLPKILDGQVMVSLVGSEGQDLPPNKSNLLESPEGGLTQQLDNNLSAHFSLKILDTSEGTMFRLLFTCVYTLEGIGPCEEKILSRPFQVYSNRKKGSKGGDDLLTHATHLSIEEKPIVIDIKPKEGPMSSETEVWIKGRNFSDRVIVNIGDKTARIIESAENLITVAVPARFDFMQDTAVPVTVTNRYPSEQMQAEKKLSFLYYVSPLNM